MITMTQRTAILLSVANGTPAPAGESQEARQVRTELTKEVAAIKARGGVVDLPPEIP